MSGVRGAIKSFFSALFGISSQPDEEFIFFWDEDDDTEVEMDEFDLSKTIRENQTEILLSISVLLILMSMIFTNNDSFILRTLPLYVALFLLLLTFYYIQTRYKDPLNMVNNTMRNLKEMDFTDTGEFMYLKNIPESLENLDKFRASMAVISSRLDDTTIELMNSLFVLEEKFRSVQFAVDNLASLVDRSGLNTANYQEIKYYSNQVSAGVDSFTSVFDDSLNSNEDVVAVVKSIGRQINMLALNAGIEAARAGEMGLGFQVVSENLRRLSQHATSTTSEMKNLKQSINTNARRALETITESMNQMAANVDSSYSAFSNLNSEIYNVKQSLQTISEDISGVQHLINTIGTELQQIKN